LQRPIDITTAISKDKSKKWPHQVEMGITIDVACHPEWDVQRIKTCLYPHDAEEVLKIRDMF
jgi:hypothetical protein